MIDTVSAFLDVLTTAKIADKAATVSQQYVSTAEEQKGLNNIAGEIANICFANTVYDKD